MMNDWLILILSMMGVVFILIAAIGFIRMPDLYMRLSLSTKAITLGVGLILLASAVKFGTFEAASRVTAIIVFLILTAPVGAHILGRASYFSKVGLWHKTKINELSGKYERKSHTLQGIQHFDNQPDYPEDFTDDANYGAQ